MIIIRLAFNKNSTISALFELYSLHFQNLKGPGRHTFHNAIHSFLEVQNCNAFGNIDDLTELILANNLYHLIRVADDFFSAKFSFDLAKYPIREYETMTSYREYKLYVLNLRWSELCKPGAWRT